MRWGVAVNGKCGVGGVDGVGEAQWGMLGRLGRWGGAGGAGGWRITAGEADLSEPTLGKTDCRRRSETRRHIRLAVSAKMPAQTAAVAHGCDAEIRVARESE